MINSTEQKIAKDLEARIPEILNDTFEDQIKDIIDIGVETYEDLLLNIVTDKYSMANPDNFYDDYVYRLETFEFLNDDDEHPTLHTPSKDVFDYSNSLSILQLIVEGVVGVYLELPEEDINTLLKSKDIDDKVKRRLRSLSVVVGQEVPLSMQFRLLHTRDTLANTVQSILDKKLVTFPFSNSAPIDLFTPMQKYVDDNIDLWIKESIDKALKLIQQRYN